jgi:predicted nucleic acid-binding protein
LSLFFDSSVLVPVFYADHPHHAASAKAFLSAGPQDFCVLRSLGEVYATLTRLPLRPRITGREAMAMLRQISDRLTLVSLSEHGTYLFWSRLRTRLSEAQSMTLSLDNAPSKQVRMSC